MYLHDAIQIDSLKMLPHELLTNIHVRPLVILEKMRKLISASNVSHEMQKEHSGALNNKRNFRQVKTAIS